MKYKETPITKDEIHPTWIFLLNTVAFDLRVKLKSKNIINPASKASLKTIPNAIKNEEVSVVL